MHSLFKLFTFTDYIELRFDISTVRAPAEIRAADDSHLRNLRLRFFVEPRPLSMESPLSILILEHPHICVLLRFFQDAKLVHSVHAWDVFLKASCLIEAVSSRRRSEKVCLK